MITRMTWREEQQRALRAATVRARLHGLSPETVVEGMRIALRLDGSVVSEAVGVVTEVLGRDEHDRVVVSWETWEGLEEVSVTHESWRTLRTRGRAIG